MRGAGQAGFQWKQSEWHGYKRHDFELDGRKCCVIAPHAAAVGKPWVWRARFFGHEPQTDAALLGRGFHVAYMDVADLFGCPKAVAHWNAFYAYLTGEHGFAQKPALEGMSRGGLIIYNWAAANPGKVACIYADAPVCDFKSWPGGKGEGVGSPESWQKCLAAYGLTEEQAMAYAHNPIDNLEPLVKAGVPALHVCGGADEVVPVAENTAILEERYKALGGDITCIIKPDGGHHPHSLKNPLPIVRFIVEHTRQGSAYAALRSGLDNCRWTFENKKKARVVFLGGSITNMEGWRHMTCDELTRRFPDTEFDFVNAGIPSTDTALGPFRMATDVFGKGEVDLLFVEFAVNDETNFRADTESVRGMEGVIRQARKRNPNLDIIMLHFVEPDKMEVIRQGKTPSVIVCHEKVASYYGVPSIDLALEVTERIDAGEFDWKAFGGIHPAPLGHRVYANSINRLFDLAWSGPLPADRGLLSLPVPEQPIDPLNYSAGRYVGLDAARVESGWTLNPSWSANDVGTRPGFVDVPMLVADTPGATFGFRFEGTAVGLCVVAGPDVGVLEYRVDDGPWREVDQFTPWSKQLHLPWAYILDADLTHGAHDLAVRIADKKNAESTGHACRIVKFLVNGPGAIRQ